MILEEMTHLECRPDQAIAFFEDLEENYLRWHPAHIAFKWLGPGDNPRARFFFDERLGPLRLRLNMKMERPAPDRIRCTPESPFWRFFFPGMSFSVEPEGEGSLYIHQIALRLGPLEGLLDHRLLVPIRQHMSEEGANLAMLTRPEAAGPEPVSGPG